MVNSMAKKRKLKKKFQYTFLIIIIIAFGLIIYLGWQNNLKIKEAAINLEERLNREKKEREEKERLAKLYNDCLIGKYNEEELSEELNNEMNTFLNYLKNTYRISVNYEDITTGFKFSYNSNTNYYAASTIKMLATTYIYQKAIAGEINLDEGVIYKSKFSLVPSYGMNKYKIGEKISLRELVKNAATISDNRAYTMLLDYIGFNNLKTFGKSLGATKTLVGGDNFGTTNNNDAMVYVKELYKTINSDNTLGEELKSYFVNSDQNWLSFPEQSIEAATKYGEYAEFFHEQGIVYDKNPYYVVILTREGNKNFEKVIKDVNQRIYKIHQSFYTNRQNYCQTQVYGS